MQDDHTGVRGEAETPTPTNTVSSSLETALYFIAMLVLLVMMLQPVTGVYDASKRGAVSSLAHGLQEQLDSLYPGESTTVRVTPVIVLAGLTPSVALSGKTVTVSLDGTTSSENVKWSLPTMTLSAGKAYAVEVIGDSLRVS